MRMTRDFSAARNPAGNTVPSVIGTSPKISPGLRSPTTRSIPSTSFVASMRPSSTAKSAPSPPSCAAYSPGTRLTSAAARLSRSQLPEFRPAKTSTRRISSAVTIWRNATEWEHEHRDEREQDEVAHQDERRLVAAEIEDEIPVVVREPELCQDERGAEHRSSGDPAPAADE